MDVSSEDTDGLEKTNDKIKEVKDLLLTVLQIIQPAAGNLSYQIAFLRSGFLCVYLYRWQGNRVQ